MKPFSDLPGEITIRQGEDPLHSSVALGVVQDLGVMKYSAMVPVTRELLEDSAVPISGLIEASFDRVLRPWRYPDRNPMPIIVLFPRLERIAAWWRSKHEPDDWDDN